MDPRTELELHRAAAAGDERAELELHRAQARRQTPGQTPADLAQSYDPIQAGLIGAGRSFTQLGRGAQDLYYRATGDDVARAELAARQAQEQQLYAPLAQANPIATAIGEAAPYMAGGLGTGAMLRGAGLGANLGGQFATGAGIGGATYAPTVQDRLMNAGVEGTLSLGGEALGQAAGAALRRLPWRSPGAPAPMAAPADLVEANLVEDARALGYNVLPSTDGRPVLGFNRQALEGGLEAMPGSSGLLNKSLQANQTKFNQHAAEAIGETANKVTDKVIRRARERIGSQFDRLATSSRIVPITSDDPLIDTVVDIADDRIYPLIAQSGDPVGQAVERALDVLENSIDKGGISARELMVQQSRLGKLGRSLLSGASSRPDLGHAVLDLQDAFMGALKRGLPEKDAAAFDLARQQYRNLMTLRQGGFDPVTGNVSPAKIATYLQRRDFRGFGEGLNTTPFYQGARFLGRRQPKLQTSGTAERMYLQNMLSGGMAVGGGSYLADKDPLAGAALGAAGAIGLPYLAGRAYLGQPLRKAFGAIAGSGPALAEQALRAGAIGGAHTAGNLLRTLVPPRLVEELANEAWFQKWATEEVKPGTGIQSHRVRLGLASRSAKLTKAQREAVKRLQDHLKAIQEATGK